MNPPFGLLVRHLVRRSVLAKEEAQGAAAEASPTADQFALRRRLRLAPHPLLRSLRSLLFKPEGLNGSVPHNRIFLGSAPLIQNRQSKAESDETPRCSCRGNQVIVTPREARIYWTSRPYSGLLC